MPTLIPSTSVEFQTLTSIPTWSETGDRYLKKLKDVFLMDLRLSNITHRYDDIEYCEDRLGLSHNLSILRDGDFIHLSVIPLRQVGETTELAQSRGGFFRKNAQTIRSEENTTLQDNTVKKGFFGNLFGGGKK